MKSVVKTPHGIAATHGFARDAGSTRKAGSTGPYLAALSVGAALALSVGIAEASPPAARAGMLNRTPDDASRSSGGERHERESARLGLQGGLDLRAPADFARARAAASDFGPADSATGPMPFPSARRAPKSESVEDRLPSLGNADTSVKITSRAEELTRRFHREGLPVARLWETHSAMVSLGLSPRGKPGIWLVQKIP